MVNALMYNIYMPTLGFNNRFSGEPGLAGGPLNSPSPFIPGLRIILGQA